MEKVKWEDIAGRIRYYHFTEYLKSGVQIIPESNLSDLKKSWRITKRIVKTRAKPRVMRLPQGGGWIVFRFPRIHGEEYITKTLDVMKCMLGEATFL